MLDEAAALLGSSEVLAPTGATVTLAAWLEVALDAAIALCALDDASAAEDEDVVVSA